MTNKIILKLGDSFSFSGSYAQVDASPVNLTGYNLELRIYNRMANAVIVVKSTEPSPGNSIAITDHLLGKFSVLITDTSFLLEEDYFVDIATISETGIKQTSKSFYLRMRKQIF